MSKAKLRLEFLSEPEDLLAAYQLRYRAYRDVGAILPDVREMFRDTFDETESCRVFGLYERDRLVASIRFLLSDSMLCAGAMSYSRLTADLAYHNEIVEAFGWGKRIIEANRFVVSPEVGRRRLDHLLVLFSSMSLVALTFGADFYVGAVRDNHVRFYERILGMEPLSEFRKYPGLGSSMRLMGTAFSDSYLRTCERWPEIFEYDHTHLRHWKNKLRECPGTRS